MSVYGAPMFPAATRASATGAAATESPRAAWRASGAGRLETAPAGDNEDDVLDRQNRFAIQTSATTDTTIKAPMNRRRGRGRRWPPTLTGTVTPAAGTDRKSVV